MKSKVVTNTTCDNVNSIHLFFALHRMIRKNYLDYCIIKKITKIPDLYVINNSRKEALLIHNIMLVINCNAFLFCTANIVAAAQL